MSGDGRIYHKRAHSPCRLTTDHAYLGELKPFFIEGKHGVSTLPSGLWARCNSYLRLF